jgi:uncharacterized Tic20 family protein
MKTCPECATPTAADAATCVVCGARFDQDAGGPGDDGEATAQPDLSGRPDPEQPIVPQEPDMTTDLADTTRTSDTPESSAATAPSERSEPSDPSATADAPAAAQAPVAPSDEAGNAADGAAVPPPSPSSGDQPSSAPDVTWPATQAGQQAGQQPPPVPPAAPPVPGALPLGESERNWGLLAHVSGLVASALVGMGFVGPLVVWLLKRDDHPFVAQNAAEALNFQLSMLLYGALLVVASLPVITLVVTLPLALVGFVLWVVLPIVAAVKASRGETWSYPLTIGFVRP